MRLNDRGRIVDDCWRSIPEHFPNVELDVYVVMPNHVHGILWILDDTGRGEVLSPGGPNASAIEVFSPGDPANPIRGGITPPLPRRPTLGQIVAYFKYRSTSEINALDQSAAIAKIWHRNYHDHIIRNRHELDRIRKYILNNAANWHLDEENA